MKETILTTIPSAIFKVLLSPLARLHLWRFRPRIVGITGNAGKTGTRTAVAAVLASRYRVRAPVANTNTDLGMAAAIIGDFGNAYDRMGGALLRGGTLLFWSRVLLRGLWGWLAPKSRYPEVLVLEYGADHPGDIKRLAGRYPAHIAVITQVGEIPVHVQYFASPKELAQEKAHLVRDLPQGGTAVLNADDLTVLSMRDATHAEVLTFGAGEGADVRVTDTHIRFAGQRPTGVAFNVTFGSATMPVSVRGTIGRGAALAAAAAVAVGQRMGVGLADACDALSHMTPPPGRLRLLDGLKGALVVDDTYNASPAAMHLAIESVRELPGRKILVLGGMLELGKYAVQAHQEVGNLAADVAAELVCVGQGGRFIADSAVNQLPKEKVRWYDDSRQAAPAVQALVRPGDVVLVKGSQGIRMERVVKEILADPQRAGELLVRQSKRWLEK